jgi:uncharacterized protein with HEPN domain
MKRDIIVYVDDILESIGLINTYTQGISQDAFIENIQLQDSVIRRLEVIGEAVKHIPVGIRRRYPTVPWKAATAAANSPPEWKRHAGRRWWPAGSGQCSGPRGG